jgi:hypothetical protein
MGTTLIGQIVLALIVLATARRRREPPAETTAQFGSRRSARELASRVSAMAKETLSDVASLDIYVLRLAP